ncbi:Icc-related predicted phosphoesterase [Nitrobacteraceae bacterium AZCC 2146]
MRIQIFSDLHLDAAVGKAITLADAIDAVVVAGDTCQGSVQAFAALRRIVPCEVPIIMVMGNHEFYRRAIHDEVALAMAKARDFNITLLEEGTAVIGGVRFVGATLWTDYLLFGHSAMDIAIHAARLGMNDHRLIALREETMQRFDPEHAQAMHHRSRAYLGLVLATPFDGPSVVVTHHAPHPGSVHPRYQSDLLSAAFVSDLSELIRRYSPDLWIHGHVHNSFDYRVGRTRIICNPHGYGRENPAFDPSLVVEVAS